MSIQIKNDNVLISDINSLQQTIGGGALATSAQTLIGAINENYATINNNYTTLDTKFNNYLPLIGGDLTGPVTSTSSLALGDSLTFNSVYNAIRYVGTSSTNSMIRFLDNADNGYGTGVSIGGGGATIIGGGESALNMESALTSNDSEVLYLTNDGNIDFYTNCQDGANSAIHSWIDTIGKIHAKDFIITDSAPQNSVLIGNGIILKYGSVGGSGAANQRINFPVAFPSTCLFVLLGTSGIGPVLRLYGSYLTSSGWDKSGFYASIIAVDKDQTYYSTGAISYIAIGY